MELESKWVIYGLRLRDSHEYRYIGYTTVGANERLKTHRYDARKRNMPVHCWLRKYPNAWQIVADVLEVCPEGDLTFLGSREQFWIATCKEQQRDKPLLNANDGGVGGTTRHLSEEHRRKISEGLRKNTNPRKPMTNEARRKMSNAHRGVPLTEQTRKTMSDGRRKGKNHPLYGKTKSAETIEKQAATLRGRTASEETKKKMSDAQKGKPKRSGHTRWHKDKVVEACIWCIKEKNEKQ